MSEESINSMLDKIIVLFRYLHDKDIFELSYKTHLAKRLLSGRTINDDAEKSLIAKLKTECGYLFSSKLEGMFKDMRISKETHDDFVKSPIAVSFVLISLV